MVTCAVPCRPIANIVLLLVLLAAQEGWMNFKAYLGDMHLKVEVKEGRWQLANSTS